MFKHNISEPVKHHTHKWVDEKKAFSPPRSVQNVSGESTHIQGILYGITTILQRCSECGELKATTVPGNVT